MISLVEMQAAQASHNPKERSIFDVTVGWVTVRGKVRSMKYLRNGARTMLEDGVDGDLSGH